MVYMYSSVYGSKSPYLLGTFPLVSILATTIILNCIIDFSTVPSDKRLPITFRLSPPAIIAGLNLPFQRLRPAMIYCLLLILIHTMHI